MHSAQSHCSFLQQNTLEDVHKSKIEGSAYELQAAQRLVFSFMIGTIHTGIWDNPHYDSDAHDRNDAVEISSDEIFQSTGRATFGCVC